MRLTNILLVLATFILAMKISHCYVDDLCCSFRKLNVQDKPNKPLTTKKIAIRPI